MGITWDQLLKTPKWVIEYDLYMISEEELMRKKKQPKEKK